MIRGHKYVYRVKAANLMGYGDLSNEFIFVPRSVPEKPTRGPLNGATKRTKLAIEFD
jgi:hypothetical protein